MTAANILLMSHGHQVKDAKDRFIQLTDLAIEDFSAATTPGNFLADVFPIRELTGIFSYIRRSLTYMDSHEDPCVVPWSRLEDQSSTL